MIYQSAKTITYIQLKIISSIFEKVQYHSTPYIFKKQELVSSFFPPYLTNKHQENIVNNCSYHQCT